MTLGKDNLDALNQRGQVSLTKASQQESQQNRSKAHRPVLTCPVPASDILTSACQCLWLGSGVLTSYEQIGEQSSLQTEAPALFFFFF